MKKGIHPDMHPMTIVFPNGDEFQTMSTFSGKKIFQDVYYKHHPAWSGGVVTANQSEEKMKRFNSKFGGFNILGGKAGADTATADEADTKDAG